MFDNYGIKDVFYGLWKYKFIIAIVLVIFTLVGYGLGVTGLANVKAGDYCASVTYFVSTKSDNSGIKMYNDSKEYAENLRATLSADFCYQSVFNYLCEKYSEDELSKILNVSKQNLSFISIRDISTVSVLNSTSLVNLYVESKNEQFAKDLLDGYKNYVENEKALKKFCTIIESGGAMQQLKGESVTSPVKIAIIFFIVGGFLSAVFVFVITLVRPTLNERGDIEQYGVTVLGEIGSKQPFEFTLEAIKKKTDGAKTLALVSADKKTDNILPEIEKAIGENMQTVLVANAFYDYESAKKASECDKAVVVVKYGHTTHETLKNVKSALEPFSADVIGVIAK